MVASLAPKQSPAARPHREEHVFPDEEEDSLSSLSEEDSPSESQREKGPLETSCALRLLFCVAISAAVVAALWGGAVLVRDDVLFLFSLSLSLFFCCWFGFWFCRMLLQYGSRRRNRGEEEEEEIGD